jgi:Na+/phosphate symporter
MITIGIPAAICILGLLAYYFVENPKLKRLGEIMFGVGLLVTLLGLAQGGSPFSPPTK